MKDTITKIVSILSITTVLCSPAACAMHRQKMVEEAISHGADPIAARCSMEIGDTSTQMCRELVQLRAGAIAIPQPPTIIYQPHIKE